MLKFSTLRPVSTPGIVDGVRLQDMHPRIKMIFYNFGWVVTDGVGESRDLVDYVLSGGSFRLSTMDVILFLDTEQLQNFFEDSLSHQFERVFQGMVRAARGIPRQLSVLTLDELYGVLGDLNLDQFRNSPHLLVSKLGHHVVARDTVLRFSQLNLRRSFSSLNKDTAESWFWEQQGFASLLKAGTEKYMKTEGSELELGPVTYRSVALTETALRLIENEDQFLFLPHPWLAEHPRVVLCETVNEQAVFEGAFWAADSYSILSGWLAHIPTDSLVEPSRAYWKKHLRTVNTDRPMVDRTLPMDLTFAVRS